MNESPVAPPPVIETPVYDPNAFVLQGENEEFLKGKRSLPHISTPESDTIATFFAVVVFMCLMAGIGFIAIGGGLVFQMVVGGILILVGAGCLAMMVWSTNPKRQKARLQGRVLVGEVVESEKIRGYAGRHEADGIGVRYRLPRPRERRLGTVWKGLRRGIGNGWLPHPERLCMYGMRRTGNITSYE